MFRRRPARQLRSPPPAGSAPAPPPVQDWTARVSLAQRMTGWTCNLVASGVMLAATLTFGRQVIQWWEPPEPVPVVAWMPQGERLEAQFGGLPLSIRRQTVHGDQRAALAALREESRQLCGRDRSLLRLPGPLEHRMLDNVAGLEPVEQCEGRWSIYQLEEPLPLVVSVQCGGPRQRVLSWGLALPADSSAWTLMTMVPTEGSAQDEAPAAQLPIPQGAHRELCLLTSDGGSWMSVTGSGQPHQWMSFLAQGFAERGWVAGGDWDCYGDLWVGRFQHREQRQIAHVIVEKGRSLSAVMAVTPYR